MTSPAKSGSADPTSVVDRIVAELGPWHEGSGPLYVKLAAGLRRLLEQGVFATGSTLPPERALADRLAVSRNTVSAAYSELRLEGWVDARQGSATTVTAASFSPVAAHRSNSFFATLLQEYPNVIDLTVAVPDASPVVQEVLASLDRQLSDGRAIASGHGYYPQGYPPLRARLAELLTESGLATTPDELLITSGAQQAISLAIRGLTRPGDKVGVEELSFPGALDSIALSGATTVPLPMTDNGVDLDALAEMIVARRPRLLFLIPTFHNPTGATLDYTDRKRLVSLIAEAGITTIDDMTLSDLDLSDSAPVPLAAIQTAAPIVTVGSLSKVYWGGLRLGWLRANETLVRQLAWVKATADLGSSAISQKVAHLLLERHDEARAWRSTRLRESLARISEALNTLLPEWRWQVPDGGPHLWIELPDTESMRFVQMLLRGGVAVVAGPLLSARPGAGSRHIRIPFYKSPDELTLAVEKMAQVWTAR